jgi:competence protein ComEC
MATSHAAVPFHTAVPFDAAVRFDAALLLALAASLGAALVCAPWVVAISTSLAIPWLWRSSQAHVLLLGLVLVACQASRASHQLHTADERYHATRRALDSPKRCEVIGHIVRSPVVFGHGKPDADFGMGHARLDVAPDDLRCEGERLDIKGLVRVYGAPAWFNRGDRIALVADLAPRTLLRNPGGGDGRIRMALDGVVVSGAVVDAERLSAGVGLRASIDRARHFVRQRIVATYSARAAPFARALVLGETDLAEEDSAAFRRSGLAHLLAVSGTHLVLAVVALGRALQAVLLRIVWLARRMDVSRLTAGVCLVGSWLYADFAGSSGSAWRAAAMLSVAMLARMLGRRPQLVRCFAVSLLGASFVEPLAIHDLSFSLSLAATVGLAAAATLDVSRAWRPFLATSAAMLACGPLLLYLAPELPLMGVLANVLAAPVGELAALPLCLVHTVLWWLPDVETGVATVASGSLWVVRAIAHGASEVSGSFVLPPPTAWQLATLGLAVLGLYLRRRHGLADVRRRRGLWIGLTVVALFGAECWARREGAPRGVLRITILDVGQGDAMLIDFPDGKLMLLDGGPGEALGGRGASVVQAALRARRRRHIDVLVLSHPHPDHYGGLRQLTAAFSIDQYWSPQLIEADIQGRPLQRWLASLQSRGTRFAGPRELCGAPIAFGGAHIEVLAPCPRVTPAASVNDNSLVMRLRFGAHAALLMGDAEASEEGQLLAAGRTLRADFLKVGHHGSRTSTSRALLAAAAPRRAAISCGVRNRFGHPHAPTLAKLSGVDIWRTDARGAVQWMTDGVTTHWGPAR